MNSFRSDKRIEAFVLLLSSIVSIILGIVFMSFISFSTKNIDIFVMAFLFLFLICGSCMLSCGLLFFLEGIYILISIRSIKSIDSLENNRLENNLDKFRKAEKIIKNVCILTLLVFFVVVLLVYDYQAIVTWSDGGSFGFLFSLIFWFVIIWSILLGLKKKE